MKQQISEVKRMQQLADIIVEEITPKNKNASKLQFILGDLCDFYGEETADDLISDEWKNYTIGQVIEDWKRLKGFIKEEDTVDNVPTTTGSDVKSTMDLSKKLKALANEMNSGKIKMDSVEVSSFSKLIDSVLSKVGKGSLGVAIKNTDKVFVSKTQSVK